MADPIAYLGDRFKAIKTNVSHARVPKALRQLNKQAMALVRQASSSGKDVSKYAREQYRSVRTLIAEQYKKIS